MPSLQALITKPFAPLIEESRGYTLGKGRADAMAGLTVAVVEVPQSLAFAIIAGVPAHYGLYTTIIQGAIGSLFASNRHLASGPTNTHSLLVAAIISRLVEPGNEALYIQLVIALTLIKGLIQLAFAMGGLGNLVRYVSGSVIIGFTAGAGVLIAVGQLPNLLGVKADRTASLPGLPGTIQGMLPHLHEVSWPAVIIGVGSLAIMLLVQRIHRLLPGPLIAVALAGTVVWAMRWYPAALPVVGELPRGNPLVPTLPSFSFDQVEVLLSGALALALLGLIETVAIGKAQLGRQGQSLDANREFFTQGIANVVGSFFQNFPGSGSFSRSALKYAAGTQTRYAGIMCSIFVLAILLLFRDQARFIPLASLAAILIIVGLSLIDWRHMFRLLRSDRSDAMVCFASFASALLLPLHYAIYVGIFLNLALYLRQASKLHIAQMVPTHGGPYIERPLSARTGDEKVLFLQVEGDLFFGVADELQERLGAIYRSSARVVIFRLKRTHSIDSTVLAVLDQFTRQMRQHDRHVLLCGVRHDILEKMQSYGLSETIGHDNIFETGFGIFSSAKQAIVRAKKLIGSSIDTHGLLLDDDDAYENWTYVI